MLDHRLNSSPLAVSITEVPRGKALPAALHVDVFQKGAPPLRPSSPPGADTFQAAHNPFASVPPAVEVGKVRGPEETFKQLLQEAAPYRRQEGAAFLFFHVTGVPLTGCAGQNLSPDERAELRLLAQNLPLMSAWQKVDLIRELAGERSPYAQVAEKLLLRRQKLSLKEMLSLGPFGSSRSVPNLHAAGAGLVLLPILCPAPLPLRPAMAGQVMASVGLLLL